MTKERSLHVLLLVIPLLALAIAVRPQARVDSDTFWQQKICAPADYDVVIVGDSRAASGLSPAVMERTLSGLRILNFAFEAQGLHPEYIAAAVTKFSPGSARPTLVLALTPNALTPYTERNDGYRAQAARACPRMGFFFRSRAAVETLFRRYPLRAVDEEEDAVLFSDGWKARRDGYDQKLAENQLEDYRFTFRSGKVSPRIVATLAAQVRALVSRGIRVFALRPPVGDALRAVEDETSGFDEPRVLAELSAAGARSIPVDRSRYVCLDESHLGRSSATKFSADVARAIAAQ